jgi:hypothetical protein
VDDDAAKIAKAKEAAAGPLGEKLAKFPLLFAKPAFFARRPSKARTAKVRNGTVTLVDLGKGPLAVTCQHVIARYRRLRRCSSKVIFQIGNVELDPIAQLVDEHTRIDLATIALTGEQTRAITLGTEIGSCVFQPKGWPPPPSKPGEFVAFGGFPGALRVVVSFDGLDFGSWSSGGSEISSVSDHQFVSAFDREQWVASFGVKHQLGLTALGGMSGGPAFISRGLYSDLAGFIREYNRSYDAIFFSSASAIRADGTIDRPPV